MRDRAGTRRRARAGRRATGASAAGPDTLVPPPLDVLDVRRAPDVPRALDAPGPDRRARVSAVDRCLFGLGLLLVGVVMWVYVGDPDGLGGALFNATSALFLLVAAVGPILRRARPRRVWVFGSLGAFGFACTTLQPFTDVQYGPFEYSDLCYFVGYLSLIVLFVLLTRLSSPRRDESYLPDALAGTAGVALALWSSVLAPLSATDLPSGAVWAAYPPLDVTLLALAIHLGIRTGRVAPPLGWFLVSILFGLGMDTFSTVGEVLGTQESGSVLDAGFLLGHFALACAFAHPRLTDAWANPDAQAAGRHPERSAAYAVLTLSPALLAITIPVVGTVDATVRAVFVVVILALLFVRMHRTLADLSRAEEDSRRRATHDPLTGLLNRPALLALLDRRLPADRERGRHTAVLFLDCDDFKYVNDTWGHLAGDALLRDVAGRLGTRLGPADLAARLGGDEFVVVGSVDDPAQARDLAGRVRALFDEPLALLAGRVHALTPSVGVAVTGPGDDAATDAVLGRADLAMYEAKQQGKGRIVVFGEALAAASGRRAAVGDRLAEAIRAGTFEVLLQPIHAGAGYRDLVGWEALTRWHDPDLGDVGPEVFVSLAERLGLIGDLGDLVLDRACRQVAALRALAPGRDLGVHVNVSPTQLQDAGFGARAARIVADAGLPPQALFLEVTETLLLDRGPDVRDVLAQVHAAGMGVCVDDFGTGYAALSTLLALPVDAVKIDRSLLAGLGVEETAARRVGAVLALLRSLGIEQVVAEGVETAEQEAELLRLGCPLVQGFRYGAPARFADVEAGLRADAGA